MQKNGCGGHGFSDFGPGVCTIAQPGGLTLWITASASSLPRERVGYAF